MIKQIAGAVSYVHEKNIVHRDLKWENVVMFGEVAKLIDFGVAATTHDILTNLYTQHRHGSAFYLPPETHKIPEEMNTEDVKKRDVWATGIMIWLLLANKDIIGERRHPLLVDKISTVNFMTDLATSEGKITKNSLSAQLDPNRLSRLDRTGLLKDLMLSCLEIDPKKRISMKEFLDELNGDSVC
ncbi:MAG: protein kinase [Parachlamydiaceae bacterium]